jgi:hypothetical protein
MAGFRSRHALKSVRVNLQLQLGLLLALTGAGLLFVAILSDSKEFLTTQPVSSHPRTYSRMWFGRDGSLTGAVREGTKLSIDFWSPEGSITDTLEVAMPGAVAEKQPWAIDTGASRVAWIVGASVYCQMLPAPSAKLTITALGYDNALRAVGILPDGSIAVPFADSIIRRWDCATGRPRGEARIALEELDQAVLEGDTLAVSSTQKGAVHLYRFQEPGVWTLAEESAAPEFHYRLSIPAPGFMVAEGSEGFLLNGNARTAPGPVRSVLPRANDVVITGSFQRVLVLPAQDEIYPLAEAPPNSLAAASRSRLALSHEQGTTLFRVFTEGRMSGRGLTLSLISGLLLGAAVLLGVAFLGEGAVRACRRPSKREPERVTIERKIHTAPRELVAACAAGETVLWAGAGLSAQAEFPDRATLVGRLLETAAVQSSVPASRIAKLRDAAMNRDAEVAMESLVLEMSAHRKELLGELKEIFGQHATVSAAHSILSRIGVGSSITTNYDDLLERVTGSLPGRILNAESDVAVESARQAFLLKLYGDLTLPQTVLLTRSELRAALDHSKISAFLGQVSKTRTLLFVGCSVEGLLADLTLLDLPRKAVSRHYLLTGVTGEAWQKSADKLSVRYGVEVLDFDAATVGTALPLFLTNLAQMVEEARARRKAELVRS